MGQTRQEIVNAASEYNVDLINRLLPSIPNTEVHKRDTLIYYRTVLMQENLDSHFDNLNDKDERMAIDSLEQSTQSAIKAITDMDNYANYIDDAAKAINFLARAIAFILPFMAL
jgi:hypothetical protein